MDLSEVKKMLRLDEINLNNYLSAGWKIVETLKTTHNGCENCEYIMGWVKDETPIEPELIKEDLPF